MTPEDKAKAEAARKERFAKRIKILEERRVGSDSELTDAELKVMHDLVPREEKPFKFDRLSGEFNIKKVDPKGENHKKIDESSKLSTIEAQKKPRIAPTPPPRKKAAITELEDRTLRPREKSVDTTGKRTSTLPSVEGSKRPSSSRLLERESSSRDSTRDSNECVVTRYLALITIQQNTKLDKDILRQIEDSYCRIFNKISNTFGIKKNKKGDLIINEKFINALLKDQQSFKNFIKEIQFIGLTEGVTNNNKSAIASIVKTLNHQLETGLLHHNHARSSKP